MRLIEDIEQPMETTTVWYLGGPTIVIQTHGCIIYVDPFLGPSVNPQWTRRFEPLIEAKSIRKVDYVLITHEHRDHCNEMTIKTFEQNLRPEYFLPQVSLEQIYGEYGIHVDEDRVRAVKPGDWFDLSEIELTVLPSTDQTAQEAVGFFISTREGSIFHPGDVLYVPSFFDAVKQCEPDIAFLPLGKNPPGWNVYPDKADFLKLAGEISAKLTIPIHWDLWNESYLNADDLENNIRHTRIKVVPRGTKLVLPLEDKPVVT
jgi:L-ascorbate metabolism protein UlaG (beta-lactamase superfamily)